MAAMKHLQLQIQGIVQGVGFRPFVHRIAYLCALKGNVVNDGQGVTIHIQGDPKAIERFLMLLQDPPALSHIESIQMKELPLKEYDSFFILESEQGKRNTLISPDIAPCEDCLKEMNDPKDRRYRYPFINCTNCGPRYTIIQDIPYDRKYTTMHAFTMCDACTEEYQTLTDRRYHAQPNACAVCGPRLLFYPHTEDDPLFAAIQALKEGKIAAIKGVGGIHFACDAFQTAAIQRLRDRKKREKKPFAVMVRDIQTAKTMVQLSKAEEALLTGKERPIVLCRKKDKNSFMAISENQEIGIVLPYSPLHVLVMQSMKAIILTSANNSEDPMVIDNAQAVKELAAIADVCLLHDRPIENRCDDSLLRCFHEKPYFVRRSRGYVPLPLTLKDPCTDLLALGAHQKGSFALGKSHHVFLSPYIGNLENYKSMQHYLHALDTYQRLFDIYPKQVICDLHPDYTTTQYARSMKLPILQVQHHYAHMASCMAEHQLMGPVFGIIWDGSGYGEDHTIWGCECLVGDLYRYHRVGSMHPLALIGGERAIHEIGRIAVALCVEAERNHSVYSAELQTCYEDLCRKEHGCVRASSMGRLFDGIYALISGCLMQDYDGQAPVLLESMAEEREEGQYPLFFYVKEEVRFFDWRRMIQAILDDLDHLIDKAIIAARFMNTLCLMAAEQCMKLNTEHLPVVLSGGCFLNQWLLSKVVSLLQQNGYRVYWHQQTSCNDEGIALGQLAIAAQRK